MADERTLYEVLEVDDDATHAAIKKSYRKLAKLHHPDTGGSGEEFTRIKKAAEVLLNEKRRANYDEHGDDSDVQMHAMPDHEQLVLNVFAQAVDQHIANGLQGMDPFQGTRLELEGRRDEAIAAIEDATVKHGNAKLFTARVAKSTEDDMRKFLNVAKQIEHTISTLIQRVEEDVSLLTKALAFLGHAKGEDLYPQEGQEGRQFAYLMEETTHTTQLRKETR